jgi:hypothetical protein
MEQLMKQEQKQRRKMLAEIIGSQPPPAVTTLDEMKEGAAMEDNSVEAPVLPDEGQPGESMSVEAELPKLSKKLIIRKRV